MPLPLFAFSPGLQIHKFLSFNYCSKFHDLRSLLNLNKFAFKLNDKNLKLLIIYSCCLSFAYALVLNMIRLSEEVIYEVKNFQY